MQEDSVFIYCSFMTTIFTLSASWKSITCDVTLQYGFVKSDN